MHSHRERKEHKHIERKETNTHTHADSNTHKETDRHRKNKKIETHKQRRNRPILTDTQIGKDTYSNTPKERIFLEKSSKLMKMCVCFFLAIF